MVGPKNQYMKNGGNIMLLFCIGKIIAEIRVVFENAIKMQITSKH